MAMLDGCTLTHVQCTSIVSYGLQVSSVIRRFND